MWGGDEILLVVPAWQGFRTLNAFYHAAAEWKFHGERLTHAGGLVFCHHKAPIYRVRDLAKRLADRVKDQHPTYRSQNLFDYLVLESIDYPTESLDHFFKQRYGETLVGTRRPLAPLSEWEELAKWLPDSVLALPKSQIYKVARVVRHEPEAFENQLQRVREVTDAKLMARAEADLKILFSGHGESWQWLHLVELWDYLAPQSADATKGDDHA